ncbi:hypothetical protein GOB87_11600 [Acetobacter estunensis]|uniref:Uncharacterized protein n=1 Tax=Acetobacter estunensis TaxID=104097 RepID=A0A967B7I4_9PROT|nr:hypothetical protein [Acetobacter estunensis]NHO54584.1 hypothetical protein [Acetobacter estunensis]
MQDDSLHAPDTLFALPGRLCDALSDRFMPTRRRDRSWITHQTRQSDDNNNNTK